MNAPGSSKNIFCCIVLVLLPIEFTTAQQVTASGNTVSVSGLVDTGTANSTAGIGLYATNGGTITAIAPVDVITRGSRAYGAEASNSIITLTDGSTVMTTGAGSYGLYGLGPQARIEAVGTSVSVGAATEAIYASGGAQISLTNSQVDSAGRGFFSLGLPDDGTRITAINTDINSTETAVTADRNSLIVLSGGSVTTTGALADGLYSLTDSAKVQASDVRIFTQGNASHGARALIGTIELQDVIIETGGSNSRGVQVSNAGVVSMQGGAVLTSGSGAHGLLASSGGVITMQGGSVQTFGSNAYGVESVNSRITLQDVSVDTRGIGGIGLVAFSTAAGSNTSLDARNVSVTTRGENAFGAALVGGARLTLVDSSISSQQATALYVEGSNGVSGNMTITDSSIISSGDSALRVVGAPVNVELNGSSLHGATSLWNISSSNGVNSALQMTANRSSLVGYTEQTAASQSSLTLTNGSTWNVSGDSFVNNLNNQLSTIQFNPVADVQRSFSSYKVLSVNNYTGTNGLLGLNTYLAGDDSPTDRLIIDGGTASGTTLVKITNSGGPGGQTYTGIKIIDAINGASTQPNSFALGGRVVAGAYEYRLVRGAADGSNDDAWYLLSQKDGSDSGFEPLYRPENAAYLANQFYALRFLSHSLDDRRAGLMGDAGFVSRRETPFWIRATSSRYNGQSSGAANSAKTEAYTLQAGADLFAVPMGNDQGMAYGGVMASFGNASAHAKADGNSYQSKGDSRGLSAGVYGTWYADDTTRLGTYVDVWGQFGSFRSAVKGDLLDREAYTAKGWALSSEVGYGFKALGRWLIEPQAQFMFMSYRQPSFTENSGVHISNADFDSTLTRLGLRIHRISEVNEVAPFAAINWWNSSSELSMKLDGERLDNIYPSSRYEVKVGLSNNFSKDLSGRASMVGAWGEHGYQEYSFQLQGEYRF